MKTCKSGRHSYEGRHCLQCQNERNKEWQKRNPKKVRASQLRVKYWPESSTEEALVKYEKLANKQHNCCAICKKGELTKDLAGDHCHETKKVRGLLCENCNRAIGMFKDSPELCYAAGKYLESSQQ
jgi:hypothetical protein